MNGGNPREDLIGHKDPSLAIRLEQAAEWDELSRNHLEGRSAAFFCYGDGGGDELDASGRPKILEHKAWFDPEQEPFENGRDHYGPLVWQCRYSGIEVPDPLWRYVEFGVGVTYSENQAEHMVQQPEVLRDFDEWTAAFVRHVAAKGNVPPGRYRAYGYRPPSHFIADLKTKWRGLRMALGIPLAGTSPAIQQERGLNRDSGVRYKRSEGAKLRD
jgi:hypothetical protein